MTVSTNQRMLQEMQQAIACYNKGAYASAQKQCEAILKNNSKHPDALHLLGMIVGHTGRLDTAIQLIQQAIAIFDSDSVYHSNLAVFLARSGNFDASIAHYREALRLKPDDPGILNNLGMALYYQKDLAQSVHYFCRALAIKPDYHEANIHLSMAYESLHKMDDAINCCQQVIRKSKDKDQLALAFNQLGNVYLKKSQLKSAITAYKNALNNKTDKNQIWSNYLLALNYDPNQTTRQIFESHCDFGNHISQTTKARSFFANFPDPKRPIRVAYMSPDFRTHPVSFFIEPLLKHHQQMDIYCYADVQKPDKTTYRLSNYNNTWIHISGYSHEAVIDQIRSDGIDILVDLAGHTAKSRSSVFAEKPAPIQISYLGYVNTTGLQTMDYRLTDAYADMSEMASFYTEKLLYMDPCFCCYQPPDIHVTISDLPALKNQYLTFGAFHNLTKVSATTLSLWTRMLTALPNSRLIIQSITLSDPENISYYKQWFQSKGISLERIEYVGYQPFEHYLKKHHHIDILLDTQPWSGHTVACHGLWMGVPVITMTGVRYAGRMVGSLLNTLGLSKWIAQSQSDYIEKGRYWAQSLDQLAGLRNSLRDKMRMSCLCDGELFTQKLERIYREIWTRWCQRRDNALPETK